MPAGRARDWRGHAGVKSLERWRACDPSPSPPCRAGTPVGGEKQSPFFKGVLASTGHRGRVDARGLRVSGATGLTRTSDRGAAAPSRVGRWRDAFGLARRRRRCLTPIVSDTGSGIASIAISVMAAASFSARCEEMPDPCGCCPAHQRRSRGARHAEGSGISFVRALSPNSERTSIGRVRLQHSRPDTAIVKTWHVSRFAQRSAKRCASSLTRRSAGTAIRSSRQPGPQRPCWPRASTRPRWPVDAKEPSKNGNCFSAPSGGAGAAGWAGAWIAGSPSFEGLDARVPLPVPSAARRHRATQSKQQARAKRPRIAKASRRAKPLPDLPPAKRRPARSDNRTLSAAAASAKRHPHPQCISAQREATPAPQRSSGQRCRNTPIRIILRPADTLACPHPAPTAGNQEEAT